jgi:quinol monooxygenase YgiN
VVAECAAAPERTDELFEALQALARASRSEPGCLSYELYRSTTLAYEFVSIERYIDRDAFAAHQVSEHFATIGRERVLPLLSKRTVQIFDV